MGMLTALALPGLWLALRRPETVLVAIWFVLSLTGFAIGGLFHGHYYVGPLTPLCALAAITLAAVPLRAGIALGLLTLVLPIYKAWPSYTTGSIRERSLASSSDVRIVTDGAVGRYLHAHTGPGDTVYAMYADASLYLAAGRRSPYPTSGSSASRTSRARCSGCATRSRGRGHRGGSPCTSSRGRSTRAGARTASRRRCTAATGRRRPSTASCSGACAPARPRRR